MLNKLMLMPLIVAGALSSAAPDAVANPSLDASATALADAKWTPLIPQLADKGPQFSVVFGDMKKGPVGLLLKFPAGFTPGPHTHSSDYWGVTIKGEISDFAPGQMKTARRLGPGGHWNEAANRPHDNECSPKGECIGFVYFPNGFDVKPLAAK